MTWKRDRAAAQAQTRTAPDARLAVLADAHTFLFADLAGFTAMTEAHGDEPAADLAEEFCQLVRELLPTFGAQEVKLIGDAIMLRVPDPTNAVRLGLAIVCDVGLRHGSPVVRVGMHSGSAVERSGDWYGSTPGPEGGLSSGTR